MVLMSRSEEKLNKVATEISELRHNSGVCVCLSVLYRFLILELSSGLIKGPIFPTIQDLCFKV